MMRDKYYIISLVSVMILGLTLIFGCGSGGGGGAPTTTTTSTTAAPTTSTTAASTTTVASTTSTTAGPTTSTTSTTSTTLPTASEPTFSAAGGTYETNAILVTLECATGGADIYYTTNGSTPDTGSIPYTGPISLEVSRTIRAIAVKSGYNNSTVAAATYDLYWWQPVGSGFGSIVMALEHDGTYLYAGCLNSPYAAKWDGSDWTSLETGLDNSVSALAMLDGDLFAGGSFTGKVTRYVSGAWSTMGSGCNNAVRVLLGREGTFPADDCMYLGGDFTSVSGSSVPANHVAKYTLSSPSYWTSFEAGVDGAAYALCRNGDDVYVAGKFTLADNSITCNNIAKWNDLYLTWEALDGGITSLSDECIYALAYDGTSNILYAGGFFPLGKSISGMDHVAQYSSGTWQVMGSGISGPSNPVRAMLIKGSDVYVFGDLYSASGVTVERMAKWDGSSWTKPFPQGTDDAGDTIYAAVFGPDGSLYIGGYFSSVGGVSCNSIAKWGRKE
ncbi:MAG: chitobiase/beta-hexosaminidase C-terminal domain-containing protein [Candidatus Saganbacteria bacterium]|nr:chitobiase/beta-hexosaminidase C-terminal domain-containing protein [Candidatus Saganbacteria bacterium]